MAYKLVSRSRYPINNIETYSGLSIITRTLQNKGDSIVTDKLTDRIRSLNNMDMISITDLNADGDRVNTPEEIKIPDEIVEQDEMIDNNLVHENTPEEPLEVEEGITEETSEEIVEEIDETPTPDETSDEVVPEVEISEDDAQEVVNDTSEETPEVETPEESPEVETSDEVVPEETPEVDTPEDTSNEVIEEVNNETEEITENVTPEESVEDSDDNSNNELEDESEIISITDQLNSANDGDTITLMEDTHLSESLVIDKAITLNLNGHNLTSDETVLDVNADVTIEGDGQVVGGTGGNYVAVYARTGNINIKGGTYSVGPDAENSGNTTIYIDGNATVNISGGHFSTESAYNDFYYVLNKKNGVEGTFIVSGGTFDNYNPANGDDFEGGSFVADGCESVNTNDNTYEVRVVEVASGTKRRRKTSTK